MMLVVLVLGALGVALVLEARWYRARAAEFQRMAQQTAVQTAFLKVQHDVDRLLLDRDAEVPPGALALSKACQAIAGTAGYRFDERDVFLQFTRVLRAHQAELAELDEQGDERLSAAMKSFVDASEALLELIEARYGWHWPLAHKPSTAGDFMRAHALITGFLGVSAQLEERDLATAR